MMEFLVNALNVKTLTMLFAAVAAAATVLTLTLPPAFGAIYRLHVQFQ